MKFVKGTLLSVLLLAPLFCAAQQLAPVYHIKTASTAYHQLTTDEAGNVYVFGTFDDLDGRNLGRLLKLDDNGNPVEGFQNLYADGVVNDLVIQTDQKILISGGFSQINGQPVSPILRLNADGSIDDTFSCPLTTPGNMELQTTGKIIILSNDGIFRRLNSDGSVDQSFEFENFASTFGMFEIAPDNSILFSNYDVIHKLTQDGADDAGFQIGPGVDQFHISALEVQSDGKVLVGGFFNSYNGVASKSIVRLNADGTVDNSFNAGNNIVGQLFQIVERDNGNILIGGQFDQYGGQPASLVELKSDGTLSRIIAVVHTNWITTILEGPESKITIAGEFESVNGHRTFGTCRFDAAYAIDQSFSPLITFNNSNGLRILANDNMQATMLGDHQMYGIYDGDRFIQGSVLRANALGGYDATFKPYVSDGFPFGTNVQADGKIIVSGGFGNGSWEILRLNADGSKDASFNTGTGATTNNESAPVYAIENIDNLIFLGGYFTHFNGVSTNGLVAVNNDGSIAKSFTALPPDSYVHRIVTQSEGKIILTGTFIFGSETFKVIRLNSDGSIDESFHRPTLLQQPSDIAVDQSDNIYLSGESLYPDGSLLKSLVKLTPDGFVDGSFNIASGFAPWGYVTAVEVLEDGNLVVGGHFDSVQGVEQPGFAILTNTGELIPQQETFFGKGSAAVDIFHKNGQLFLAGKFKTRDYTEAYAFVKVLLEDVTLPSPPSDLSVSLTGPGTLSVDWTANSSNHLAFVVERAINNMDEFVVIDTVEANLTAYIDNINRDHFNAYRVRAINEVGYSYYSNIDSLKWAPAPQGTLTLSASYDGTQVVLSWPETTLYHDGFIVQRSSTLETGYQPIDSLGTSAKSFTDATAFSDLGETKTYHYRLLAYNTNGTLTSNVASTTITSIESGWEPKVKIYPNPAKEYVFVSTNDPEFTNITIMDRDGRVLSRNDHPSSDMQGLDITSLPPGIYFVKVSVHGKPFTTRLVKGH